MNWLWYILIRLMFQAGVFSFLGLGDCCDLTYWILCRKGGGMNIILAKISDIGIPTSKPGTRVTRDTGGRSKAMKYIIIALRFIAVQAVIVYNIMPG